MISRCGTEIVITAESAAVPNSSLNHDNAAAVIIESLWSLKAVMGRFEVVRTGGVINYCTKRRCCCSTNRNCVHVEEKVTITRCATLAVLEII